MKQIINPFLVFAVFLFFTCVGHADEGIEEEDWVKKYRKELKNSGYSDKEIEKHIAKEKEKRRKKTAENKKIKKPDEKTVLKELEKKWREKLEDEGLDKKDVKAILKEEMKVQRKIIKFKGNEKDLEEFKIKCYIEISLRRIKAFKKFKEYPKDMHENVASDYKEWFYLSLKKVEKKIKDLFDAIDEEDIKNRKKKSHDAKMDAKKEFDLELANLLPVQRLQMYNTFNTYWEYLADKPKRLYEDEKTKIKKKLKQGGFQAKHVNTFFKHLDPLFAKEKD